MAPDTCLNDLTEASQALLQGFELTTDLHTHDLSTGHFVTRTASYLLKGLMKKAAAKADLAEIINCHRRSAEGNCHPIHPQAQHRTIHRLQSYSVWQRLVTPLKK